ncbi:hypothetical protein [Alishewanella jeotgali]|nr:hypothetical protein [Alishewanella jeotgali]
MLIFSLAAKADFKLDGQLSLHLSNGEREQKAFPLSLIREQGAYLFSVGELTTRLPSPLQKYSLALVLQHEQEVWVTDFSPQPLQGFNLQLPGYEISLYRDPQARTARGRFVLQMNEELYYFSRGPGQINFLFNDQGISEVRVQGMFKPRR